MCLLSRSLTLSAFLSEHRAQLSCAFSLSVLLSSLCSAQLRDGDAALALRSLNLSHQLCGNRRRFRFVSFRVAFRGVVIVIVVVVASFRFVTYSSSPPLPVVFVGVAYLGLGQRFALLGMCARALAF